VWAPWLLIDCGLHPWDVTRYTVGELRQLRQELDRRAREAGE
jgi:hypothetical protein